MGSTTSQALTFLFLLYQFSFSAIVWVEIHTDCEHIKFKAFLLSDSALEIKKMSTVCLWPGLEKARRQKRPRFHLNLVEFYRSIYEIQ